MAELTGPEYFGFAYRMSAYSGVMAARFAKYEEDRKEKVKEAAGLAEIFSHGEHVKVGA